MDLKIPIGDPKTKAGGIQKMETAASITALILRRVIPEKTICAANGTGGVRAVMKKIIMEAGIVTGGKMMMAVAAGTILTGVKTGILNAITAGFQRMDAADSITELIGLPVIAMLIIFPAIGTGKAAYAFQKSTNP